MMTLDEMATAFEAVDCLDETDEYLKFDRVQCKRSKRPDLHAFLLLDDLVPGDKDMVASADHDKIWLGVSAESVAAIITPEQVTELVRCGVHYDAGFEGLAMFA